MGRALFVYGTLMDATRVAALTGRRLAHRPATLQGWERTFPAALGGYANIVPRRGACVDGIVLLDVDMRSLRAFDAYEDEGRLYVRRPVEVVADGTRIACEVYVGNAVSETVPTAPARARGRTRRPASHD